MLRRYLRKIAHEAWTVIKHRYFHYGLIVGIAMAVYYEKHAAESWLSVVLAFVTENEGK